MASRVTCTAEERIDEDARPASGTVLIGVLIMAALVYKAIDLIKYVTVLVRRPSPEAEARSEAWSGLLALVLGAVLGVGIVFLMDVTSWTNEIKFGTATLVTMSFWDKVVLGLVITSIASSLFDIKKAIDGTDSASTPKLLPRADEARRARVAEKLATPTPLPPPPAATRPDMEDELRSILDHELRIEKAVEGLLHQP